MSWSSDIRCLYCDGRLPLYRKITSGQFCSTAHRKLYWQEQERLGLERLHQTHDSLRAFHPPEGVNAILGPPPSGIIVPEVAPKYDESPAMLSADPYSYESELAPRGPLWAPQIAEDSGVDAPCCRVCRVPEAAAEMADRSSGDSGAVPAVGGREDQDSAARNGGLRRGCAGRAGTSAEKIPIEPRNCKGASRVEALFTTMLPTRRHGAHRYAAGDSPRFRRKPKKSRFRSRRS